MEADKTLYKSIYKKNKEKELKKIKVFNSILKKCEKKIKLYANNDKFECYFEIPKFYLGAPLYNIDECVFFMIHKLKNKFKVHYFSPDDLVKLKIADDKNSVTGILYISWQHIKDKLNKLIY